MAYTVPTHSINNFITFLETQYTNNNTPMNFNGLRNQILSRIRRRERRPDFGARTIATSRGVRHINPSQNQAAHNRAANRRREQRILAIARRLGANQKFLNNLERNMQSAARTPSPPRSPPKKKNKNNSPPRKVSKTSRGSRQALAARAV
jgi:hypothetical protein